LSDRTIDSYQRHLQKWLEYQGDLGFSCPSSYIHTYHNLPRLAAR
jgi:hypothetical protein